MGQILKKQLFLWNVLEHKLHHRFLNLFLRICPATNKMKTDAGCRWLKSPNLHEISAQLYRTVRQHQECWWLNTHWRLEGGWHWCVNIVLHSCIFDRWRTAVSQQDLGGIKKEKGKKLWADRRACNGCSIMYFCSSNHLIWSPNTVGISGACLKEGRSLKIISVKEGKALVICPWCWENVGIIGLDLLNDYVNVIILHITFQII